MLPACFNASLNPTTPQAQLTFPNKLARLPLLVQVYQEDSTQVPIGGLVGPGNPTSQLKEIKTYTADIVLTFDPPCPANWVITIVAVG